MTKNKWSKESWFLEATSLDLALAEPFTIASKTWHSTSNVFVSLGFGGVIGVGEASPDSRSDESVASVVAQLEKIDPADLVNPFNFEGVREILPPGAARAAVDIALHDLAGKIAGLPVCKLLGTKGRRIPPTSMTVPIGDRDRMLERCRRLADYPIIKIKVGFDGDVETVGTIRDVYSGAIRIDANEGWDASEATARLTALERYDIELCEQPVPAGDHDALGKVAAGTSIPVFADEDVSTATDVARLAGVVDGVNLKLRKAGGIRETMHAIATARAHGLRVMIGCDLESGVATTAGAHVAGLTDHVDLDGPLLLAEDPFPGIGYDGADIVLPDVPGLGVKGAPS